MEKALAVLPHMAFPLTDLINEWCYGHGERAGHVYPSAPYKDLFQRGADSCLIWLSLT